MAQLSVQTAIELIEASAVTLEDKKDYVQTEVGYAHDWLPVEKAVEIVKSADGVFLRPNEGLVHYRLMTTRKDDVVRFEVDN